MARRAGVVAADVPGPVRAVHAVPGDPRGHPFGGGAPVGVLPGGVALQVRQQALHAVVLKRELKINDAVNFEKSTKGEGEAS